MALNLVTPPADYYPDFNQGRPVFNGQIFVGIPDLDPEIVGDQKQVTIRQEDGTEVQVSQPVLTGSGGVPTYLGSPVQILVDGNYSIKVLNSQGSQVYYLENAFNGEPVTTADLYPLTDARFSAVFGRVADMLVLTPTDGVAYVPVSGQSVYLTSYYTSIPFSEPQGGGGHIRVMTLAEYALTPDELGAAWTVGGFAFVRDLSEGVTLKDFGARDGVESTAAIQAAFAASPKIDASGGPYLTTAPIVLTQNTFLTGDSYDYSLSQSECTFLCGFDNASQGVFAFNNFLLSLNTIALDMDGNTTEPVDMTGTSANLITKNVLVTRCGGNGIIIPASSGVSHIDSVNIDFFPITIEDGSDIVPGTVGIEIADSDNVISNCEVKGGFDIGVKLSGGNNVVINTISDQCNIGMHDVGSRNMITSACRMQFNYECGLKVGSTAPIAAIGGIYTNNNITRNNPLRSQTAGSYTGVNVILERMDGGVLVNNQIDNSETGVRYIRVDNNAQIGFNGLRDLDGLDYDISSNTGSRTTLIEERKYSSIAGSTQESQIQFNPFDLTGLVGGAVSFILDKPTNAGEMGAQLWDVNHGGRIRVKVGANNSGPGGSGRALFVDNT